MGAIANLVDEIGATVVHEKDAPMDVSVDMSISYVSTAKLNVCLMFTTLSCICFAIAIYLYASTTDVL